MFDMELKNTDFPKIAFFEYSKRNHQKWFQTFRYLVFSESTMRKTPCLTGFVAFAWLLDAVLFNAESDMLRYILYCISEFQKRSSLN